jgi:hypothetical protein
MQDQDEKPVTATAMVVAVVLGIAAVVRVVTSTHGPNLEDRYPGTSAPLWTLAGK